MDNLNIGICSFKLILNILCNLLDFRFVSLQNFNFLIIVCMNNISMFQKILIALFLYFLWSHINFLAAILLPILSLLTLIRWYWVSGIILIFDCRLLWWAITLLRVNELLYNFLEFFFLLFKLVPVSFNILLHFLNMVFLIFFLLIVFWDWFIYLGLLFSQQCHIFLHFRELYLFSLHRFLCLWFLFLALFYFLSYSFSFIHVLLKLPHYILYVLVKFSGLLL